MMNNTNKHAYMQADVDVMFTQIHTKKVIKFFGERAIASMIKEFNKLGEVSMPVKLVVVPLNTDELTYTERMQEL